ncbi:MAG TPA: alpha/beta fold hydrolase [Vicinamibacterales bacterium]|nr:alpha/beta fold hydrolase [Vicinamibacterales bacterium]
MRLLTSLLVLAMLPACMVLGVREQRRKLDAACQIGGRVEAEQNSAAPLIVVLARQTGSDPASRESWQISDHFVVETAGLWQFAASAGTYGVVAFQDLNRDLRAESEEPYLALDRNRIFTCMPGERRTDLALKIPAAGRSRLGETIDVATLQVRTVAEQFDLSLGQVTAVGEVADLSDPRFDESVADDGLWRPYDFLFEGRPGVYFLGPYDRTRIPVLFVHGISGTPRHFATLIEALDKRRFQPWVYYYPSGTSLARVADHLTQTIRKVQLEHGVKSFIVVAHSMGGLVARGFLLRYREGSGAAAVPLFVSISTPWDGHKAAQLGAKSPIPVLAWDDMSPGSEYLRSLHARDPGVPHDLIFTFRNEGVAIGEASDGTVSVASQLQTAVQKGAMRVEGYNETHMGVLEAAAVSARLNELLSAVAK